MPCESRAVDDTSASRVLVQVYALVLWVIASDMPSSAL